jgi:hypothetical protein
MKQYWKDGQIVERPRSLVYNGMTYVPPTDEILLEAGYEIKEPEITLEDVLLDKIEQIESYNVSENVDRFYINDKPMWLNRELRNSLMSRFNAEKNTGVEITNIWYDGEHFSLPVDIAINMLIDLELYASQCFDNTQKHLYNVKQLTSVDAVIAYDYTVGYPEKLNLTIL